MLTVERNSDCASATTASKDSAAQCWRAGFLQLLPRIERDAQLAFRGLKGETQAEAVQEVVCNACVAYARLAEQGRSEVANASSLARFAVTQYLDGRRVGSALNVRDVTSVHCHLRHDVQVESLHFRDRRTGEWSEMLVEDRSVTPAELAASRIDYPAFLDTLPPRKRQIAETLAVGETTQYVAQLFGLSAGRISQLRQELEAAWERFHASPMDVLAPI